MTEAPPPAVWFPAAQLVPWEDNPWTHPAEQLAELRASFQRHGWGEPVVAQASSAKLIAGHGRVSAALALPRRGPRLAVGGRAGPRADPRALPRTGRRPGARTRAGVEPTTGGRTTAGRPTAGGSSTARCAEPSPSPRAGAGAGARSSGSTGGSTVQVECRLVVGLNLSVTALLSRDRPRANNRTTRRATLRRDLPSSGADMNTSHAAAIGTFLGTGWGDARDAQEVRREFGHTLLAQLVEGGWLCFDPTTDTFVVTPAGKRERAAHEMQAEA